MQLGMAPGTIDVKRMAVIRGRVSDRQGRPLSGVLIRVLNRPQYGETMSRPDGNFDLAVNGGGILTLVYTKPGYFSAERQVRTVWQDYAFADSVVMFQPDRKVTTIHLDAPIPMQVAQGSVVTDADGTRQATLLFPQGTQATLVLSNGTTKPLATLHVRETEVTVGATGPQAMPGELPPASGYTYAVENTADEAIQAQAQTLRFSQPVIQYVSNFLHFPVGMIVPSGYFDRTRTAWVPSQDGRVVKILRIAHGLAVLNVDGHHRATPAELASLHITPAERHTLAVLYKPGQSLWRVAIEHFSWWGYGSWNWYPWDFNWGIGPPPGSPGPNQPNAKSNEPQKDPCTRHGGSVIECQNQTVEESIPIAGTPFSLHYKSSRVPGYRAADTIAIPLSGATIPAALKRIDLSIDIAGRQILKSFPVVPNQTYTFVWDGKNIYGEPVSGQQPVTIGIGYVYPAEYIVPSQNPLFTNPNYDAVFGHFSYYGLAVTGNPTDREVTIWQVEQSSVNSKLSGLGTWDARAAGLGGWTLDAQQSYDPVEHVLYGGDGSSRRADQLSPIITTVAGSGSTNGLGDGGPAAVASLAQPGGLTVAPDGSVYIADSGHNRVRKVTPDGKISTVAGTGTTGYSGDGGPATAATLSDPEGLAVGPDGSLYIADANNDRIRRVSPAGMISTVAGSGVHGFQGDGGPATRAALANPKDVVVTPDGTLYIADSSNNRVREVMPDGIITTVAGNGSNLSTGDYAPAGQAGVPNPIYLALDAHGALYVSTAGGIRRVDSNGVIVPLWSPGEYYMDENGNLLSVYARSLAVGNDGGLYITSDSPETITYVASNDAFTHVVGRDVSSQNSPLGDNGPATRAVLSSVSAIALGPDGSLYIADNGNARVRHVSGIMPDFSNGDLAIPSNDGALVYEFDQGGQLIQAVDAHTGAVQYSFGYNNFGYLTSITDGDGNTTVIAHDSGSGNPVAIFAPHGQRTVLTVDSNRYLSKVTDPAGNTTSMTYTPDGLLTSFTDPRGDTSTMAYDNRGRLIKDQNAAGGYFALAHADNTHGFTTTLASALNRTTTYEIKSLATGQQERINTFPDGTKSISLINPDDSETDTLADRTVATLEKGPDPRFGMVAPLVKSLTVKTPSGLTSILTTDRRAILTDPTNPLSLSSETTQIALNGNTYTVSFDAKSRQYALTSPAGRRMFAAVDGQGRIKDLTIPGIAPVHYQYDAQGRLAAVTQGSGAQVRTTQLAYNPQGFLSSLTDAAGLTQALTEDPDGRIAQQTLPGGRVVQYSLRWQHRRLDYPREHARARIQSEPSFKLCGVALVHKTFEFFAGSGALERRCKNGIHGVAAIAKRFPHRAGRVDRPFGS